MKFGLLSQIEVQIMRSIDIVSEKVIPRFPD
jgi:hypothetical protein